MSSSESSESSLMESKSTLFEQGSITLVGNIVGKIIGFGFFLVVPRILDRSTFGSYTLSVSIISLILAIASLNLNRAIDYFVPKALSTERESPGRIVLVISILTFMSSIFVYFLVLVYRVDIAQIFNDQELAGLLPVVGLLLPLLSLHRVFLAVFNANKTLSFRVYSKEVTLQGVKLIGAVALLSLGYGLSGVAWAHVVGVGMAVLVAAYFSFRNIPWLSHVNGTAVSIPNILKYSLPLAFAGVAYAAVGQIDFIVLGLFTTPEDVAGYRLTYLLSINILIFHQAVTPVLKSLISESGDSISQLKAHYRTSLRWVTIVTLPVAATLLLAPGRYMGLLFSARYAGEGTILLLLVLGQLINTLLGPAGRFLESRGRTRIVLINTMFLLVVNSSLDIILVQEFGVTGVATGTATALILTGLLSTSEVYYFDEFVPIPASIGRTWLSGLATFTLCSILLFIIHLNVYVIFALPFLVVSLYVLLLYKLRAFNEDDLEIAESLDKKIGRRVVTPLVKAGIKD